VREVGERYVAAMPTLAAILLVGHGATARDTPRDFVAELKQLERERERRGDTHMSDREAELDRIIRHWPRTPTSDPYKHGLESIAASLATRIAPRKLVVGYNEFCAPSVDEALAELIADGIRTITIVTTMFTPGGSHAEIDIPNIVQKARERYASATIHYAWPFDPAGIADFLARHLEAHSKLGT
jgi:sirohydrochlorin cobaltochelatase